MNRELHCDTHTDEALIEISVKVGQGWKTARVCPVCDGLKDAIERAREERIERLLAADLGWDL